MTLTFITNHKLIKETVNLTGGGVDGSGKVQAPFYDHLMQASGLVRKNAYLLVCTGSTGTWSTTESVSQDATSGTLLDFKSGAAGAVTLTVTTSTGEFGTGTITGAGGASATVTSAVDGIAYVPTSCRFNPERISNGICADPTFMFDIRALSLVTAGLLDAKKTFATASFALTYADYSTTKVLPNIPPVRGATVVVGDLSPPLIFCDNLELKMANAISKYTDILTSSKHLITGRKPAGSIDLVAPSLTDFNPPALARAGTTLRIEALFGTTHGNRFKVVVPYAQLDMPDFSDREGLIAYNLSFTCTGKKGNDELYFLFL
jgi:hypothetical protein